MDVLSICMTATPANDVDLQVLSAMDGAEAFGSRRPPPGPALLGSPGAPTCGAELPCPALRTSASPMVFTDVGRPAELVSAV